MAKTELKTYRQGRLQAFLDEKYAGNKTKLGQALGYVDGAMIGQMLSEPQIRPITEKTIDKIHNLPGGFGWFDEVKTEPADTPVPSTSTILLSLSDDAVMIGALFDKAPKESKGELFFLVNELILRAVRGSLQSGGQAKSPAQEKQSAKH